MGLIGDIKDVAGMVQKADNIELYAKILNIQATALEMQEEIRQLKEENAELKKIDDIELKIVRNQLGNVYPYFTLKDDDQKIRYCSTCWGVNRQLIQISVNYEFCNACAQRRAIRS